MLEFEKTYLTHKVAFYNDWLIVERENPGRFDRFYAFGPDSVDFSDEDIISDFDYLLDFHIYEWAADSLQELMDFIDCYEED